MATTTRTKTPAKKRSAKKVATPLKRARLTKKAAAKRTATASGGRSSYDRFKEFEGEKYTGMKIGRSHKWHYDQGEWKERKMTPDQWQIHYAVTKRRAGKAPEGSGVPVGTEYHWYILAHQHVRKLNANDYSTEMTGIKFKLAHKRADKSTWSASPQARRKRLIRLLQGMITRLEAESENEAKELKAAKG